MNNETMYLLLSAIVTLAVIVVVPYVRKMLLARLTTDQLANAATVALMAVKAVEQISVKAGWSSEAKKAAALKQVRDLAARFGINLTDQQWGNLIEQAVLQMKVEWQKPPAVQRITS